MSNHCAFVLDRIEGLQLKKVQYKCQEDPTDTGFCIFHDKKFVTKNPEKLSSRITEKIEESEKNNSELNCIGYNIPQISFDGFFDMPINFMNASFHGSTNFASCNFKKHANFSGANFQWAYFDECYFDTVSFVDCKFGTVSFFNSKFSGKTHFDSISINNHGSFSGADFREKVSFRKSKFFGIADFSFTQFKEADFQNSEFRHKDPVSEIFSEKSDNVLVIRFDSAIFDKVNFSKTKFVNKGYTDFSNAVFDEAYFTDCEFMGKTRFTSTEFSRASFRNVKFAEKTSFLRALFKNQNLVVFTGNLSNVSFSNSDISRVIFSEDVIWGGKDGFTVLDERNAREMPGVASLGTLLAIYRNLRENYEFRLRYDEAGQFFIKEMNLKREFREKRK